MIPKPFCPNTCNFEDKYGKYKIKCLVYGNILGIYYLIPNNLHEANGCLKGE